MKAITHNGSFHADDVFAVATLQLVFGDDIEVIRTRDVDVIKTGDIVVDVGGVYAASSLRFDHHQSGGAGKRQNSIPYAAFGLVWRHYGEKLCASAQVSQLVDERLVQAVDAIDNGIELGTPTIQGVYPYSISSAIGSFVPVWSESASDDERFKEAVAFAKKILEREIVIMTNVEESRATVAAIYEKTEDKRIIVLDKDYLWGETLSGFPEPLFAVYPTNDTWHVKAVRNDIRSFKIRKEFPAAWAGKRDAELAAITSVSDALFCHNKLFLAVAKSKEGAVALAKLAIVE